MKDIIRRDLRLSYLLGPFRIVVPILGYIILYPVILSRYDASILGLWSLLAVIPQALSSIDFGFSLVLTRIVGGAEGDELDAAAAKYRTAQKAFLLIWPILILLAVGICIAVPMGHLDYSVPGIQFSIVLMAFAVIVQRLAALDTAILNGLGDNYFTHSVAVWSPILYFGTAVGGALAGMPIEALSVGFLAASAVSWWAYRRRLRIRHTQWSATIVSPAQAAQLRSIRALMREGWLLYAASLGIMLRDPILRYSIGLSIGLDAVAIYEVAMRLGRIGRDIVTAGFSALYASFAVLIRQQETQELREITGNAMLLLCLFGGGLIGGTFLFAPTLLQFWLGDIATQMVEPTRIVCAWAAVTLLNTPFWYQLLAGQSERHAARAIWLHTLSVALIVPAALWMDFGLNSVLLYWLAGSILTQVYLFYYAEKLYGLVIATFSSVAIATVIIVQLLSVAILLALISQGTLTPFVATAIFGLIVVALLVINKRTVLGLISSTHVDRPAD